MDLQQMKQLRRFITTLVIGYGVGLVFVPFGMMLTAAFVLVVALAIAAVQWLRYLLKYLPGPVTVRHHAVALALGLAWGGHFTQMFTIAKGEVIMTPVAFLGPEISAVVAIVVFGLLLLAFVGIRHLWEQRRLTHN